MRVTVQRITDGNIAPDILFDQLCNVKSVGVDKGSAFLYDLGFDKLIYQITMPYRNVIYPSDLIAVHYNDIGESFVARVKSHEIKISMTNETVEIESVLTVERSLT